MLSTYCSFPMQTTENELVDERWDSDLQSSITNHKNMNNKKDYATPNSLQEINHLSHSNTIVKITPNKKNDDDYFEITTAPPDYPSTPSVTEDDEEDDYLSTPPLNEASPLESNLTYCESLEEDEDANQYFVSESICDYHSDLLDYYKQIILSRFDHISTSRLQLIESTLPEIYKQKIMNLRSLY